MPQPPAALRAPFREREFYLAEFRGRTLALVLPRECRLGGAEREVVSGVLDDLRDNHTPVVLISDDADLAGSLAPAARFETRGADWLGLAWRALQKSGCVALIASPEPSGLASLCRRLVLEARVAKVVWLGEQGMLWLPDGRRRSLVPLADIEACARQAEVDDEPSAALLREFERMIRGSASSISACLPGGLADELFTYAGSGTFYAREGYTEVRDLGLDDFDAAEALIHYGVEEGYLLERSAGEVERALTHGIGAFIEGRYLAGICALLPHDAGRAGEIASLYALTRFVGEGVGVHLVRTAIERAGARGMESVFACTTSERVEAFFTRLDFQRVESDALPESKWKGYDEKRRREARCLRYELG